MRVIGLTGGIGTGKSTVAGLLRQHGFAVVDADRIARESVEPGSPVLADIVAQFGKGVLNPDGHLDRERLGKQVFADPSRLSRLNGITHPAILARMKQEIGQLEKQGVTAVFLEVPLLYETGMDKWCEAVIAVRAHPDVQLARLKDRGLDEAEARARIVAQWPDEQKATLARYVIDNSGHLLQTESELTAILKDLGI